MTRLVNRLSARSVATITKPGRHADGGGLYLVVDVGGARRWAFLFRWEGKLKEMGLGGVVAVPLGRARELARDCRAAVAARRNPISERKSARSTTPSFGAYADDYMAIKSPGWRNAKHRQQWTNTLLTYAAPLRALQVDQVTTEDVLAVLKPIWLSKSETAARLRGRIEAILDAARASGHRSGDNPARWRGHLDMILPKRRKLVRGHHRAMDFDKVPGFVARLRAIEGVAARALEFLILTAARTGEVTGALRLEFDVEAKLWTVPGARMKGGREHRVPLTDRALAIVSELDAAKTSDFLFPGRKRNRPLSNMAFEMILRRIQPDATAHGFRSSFRDWCGERTEFPSEIAEAALAHLVGDETERAYRRRDALDKRRAMMAAWAEFCEPTHAMGGGRS